MKIRLPFLFFCFILSACSALDDPVLKTFSHVASFGGGSGKQAFDPRYRFLRIVLNGHDVYAILGFVDKDTEVWYGAGGFTLRIREGRVAGAEGASAEWRNVILPEFPSWNTLEKEKVYRWERRIDIMPGYRYGVRDELVLRAAQPRKGSNLEGIDPDRLAWFEETSDHFPPARYAVDLDRNEVVYAETCLSKKLCFSWQRWK